MQTILQGTQAFNQLGQGAQQFKGLSDARLKQNIQPVSWQWKADATGTYMGVVAQQLQQSHPHLVSTHEDGHLMVDYGALTAMLLSERAWLYTQLEAKGAA